MGLFGRRAGAQPGTPEEAPAAVLSPSRILQNILTSARRRGKDGQGSRVLVAGPPSSRTIETFHALACRVTVDGEFVPTVPLRGADESIDLVLGYDCLDLLPDKPARALASEWARVLAPGGVLYLIARREREQMPPFLRVDVNEDGSLRLHSMPERRTDVTPRQNGEIERLVRPLTVDEIYLRRDGLREMRCKKA